MIDSNVYAEFVGYRRRGDVYLVTDKHRSQTCARSGEMLFLLNEYKHKFYH